jgi:aminoglycoside phosphotransferase (APT) family kinase protein
MSIIDQPKETRAEDALNVDAVSAFVKLHYPSAAGALDIKQFRGGASNLTYQLNFENISLIL